MKTSLVAIFAILALAGARLVREVAVIDRDDVTSDAPYAPSPQAARLVSLGYRELFADLLYMRLRVYFGGYTDTTSQDIAAMGDAIVALDPKLEHIYSYAANAMTITPAGADQRVYLKAIALLERGMREFPNNSEMPLLAGQMYVQDLETQDPVQRRRWDERGVLLVESAIRKPGASLKAAVWAATLRTKLGQHQRAADNARELLLITNNKSVRDGLLKVLAHLEKTDAAEIASEIYEERTRFENEWRARRPAVKPSMYILLGPPLPLSFDMTELATGGQDFVGSEGIERLEPLYDEPTSAGGPSSP